jgi:acetylglutamate kinase
LDPDLGAVGRIVSADGRLLRHLIAGGFLPVVACVAGGAGGEVFNVNADAMAAALAIAAQSELLTFLTDVPGVKGKDGAVIPTLTSEDCRRLIREGVATGGMEAKLNAALQALEGGVRRVLIAPGATPGIPSQALTGDSAGSVIVGT